MSEPTKKVTLSTSGLRVEYPSGASMLLNNAGLRIEPPASTPIYDALVREQDSKPQLVPTGVWLVGHASEPEDADAPSPSFRLALAIVGAVALLAVVLLVLTGLGWN